ncbi:uncharacterized protein [Drosophila kikkawai]|uniref:Uncharacterized protein LOC108082640 n=1 Tax=Drosophila kikkawai TaxID=30033 RepID=A0A6P4IYB9_DROKI|nr:uncharacterized protein LOC108082640 [Drosophila kikkawai]XP_017033600.1 uncharacterized protein LOC108082640 [Drosophila kikkawai]XP_017033601.1 uncharacterized protein LOC108082640 [Drosophila kikkawai]XP_017033602.1 uncharacterized protein LOC108082640 [Drosophila kikkawai]XP_017033603.1 uncharacterized protein LOC108082640 [Drosophila kikkawai]XP_017033605.1 uncharacterized protein LOC108082640 [Drosophila kikkawai]
MYYWSNKAAQSQQMQLQKILPLTQLFDIENLKSTKHFNAELSNNNNQKYLEDETSIDKAKLYFVQSGILGPNTFKESSDLIRKTSTIHADTCLRNQIRRTSLCLRSRVASERMKSYDDTLIVLKAEINLMRRTLDQGEIKIITLRTEIGKLKRLLQKIMHVQMEDCRNHTEETLIIQSPMPGLCLFCQQKYSTSVK